ncbi:MAG TPA: magnesium transporter CorA family protein [Kiritimatiellia bacterium]|nr:magnesium transporter CorA family protein [Kiritimatiellia bacterium]HMO99471.1 magnesium transporter CorA family protein [Kiritimatiellia bacterium]HMP97076.1 magnesium transporter CorA family protein [Kiritimatiellia bacterium]
MISIIQFDFCARKEKPIEEAELESALAAGFFCWVDMNCSVCADRDRMCTRCATCLERLGVNELARREVLGPDREGRYDVHDDCLHFAVTEAGLAEGRLQTAHVDIVLGAHYMVTFRRHEATLVNQVKRTYREDFYKFAQSPGFLLYEIADHLTETYRRAITGFAESVERIQLKLFGEVDDTIFREVSTLTQDILGLRKVVTASRELLHELASRRSPFVSETTQPFLENMAGTLERLSADLTTEREVLNETLNLYMGMVSHRTNKVVNRLTIISAIFLPLTFICGVYGVNLQGVPEFEWEQGYLFFWTVCILIAVALVTYMRRRKWL